MPVDNYHFLSSAVLVHLLSPIHVDRTKLPHKINLPSSSRSPTGPPAPHYDAVGMGMLGEKGTSGGPGPWISSLW